MKLISIEKANLPIEQVTIDEALKIIKSLYIYERSIPWTLKHLEEITASNACTGNVCVDVDDDLIWVWRDGISLEEYPPERCLKIIEKGRQEMPK